MSILSSWFARGMGLIARAATWVGERILRAGELFERFGEVLGRFGEEIPKEEQRKAWEEVKEEVSLRDRLVRYPEKTIIPEDLHASAIFPIDRKYAYTVAVHVYDEREERYTDKFIRVLSDRRLSKEEAVMHASEEVEHLIEETGTQWRVIGLEIRSAHKQA